MVEPLHVTHSPRVEDFLGNCEAFLSSSSVIREYTTRNEYSKDCAFVSNLPDAILLPASVEQLKHIVLAASRFQVSLYTVSTGKNWGYGSASPTQAGSVVVDLKRMNKILEIDKELAYVVIEPGVTQQQLYDYLQLHAPKLCMDVTGSSPDSSIVGNLVERGYGQTPYGDRFLNSAGMEVLLSNGEVVSLGFGHYRNAKSRYLYKWGIGPYLDGLFTQSNMGIVTKVGLWLMPKPPHIGLLTFGIDSDAQLSRIIPVLRDLKLQGRLPATVHLSNDVRLISCFTQFRKTGCDPSQELSEPTLLRLRKEFGFSQWTCFTSLRGSAKEISTTYSEIKKALTGLARTSFITGNSVRWAKTFGRFSKALTGRTADRTEMLFNLVSGKPTYGPTLGAFWRFPRKPTSLPLNPAGDGCGITWLVPVFPSTSRDTMQFLSITKSILRDFKFETNITLTMLSERSLCATVAITFDKDRDMVRAQGCYEALLSRYVDVGLIPYRHGINVEQARSKLFDEKDPFWKVCRSIKEALDPQSIFSPGKYGL